MAEIPVQSHLDLVEHRLEEFEKLLDQGAFDPLLLRHIVAPIFLVIVSLLIRPRRSLHSQLMRYTFHAIITGFSIYTVLHVRFIGPGNGYAVGLVTTWFYIWVSTLLVFNDVRKDFKRIEKEYVRSPSPPLQDLNQHGDALEPKDTKYQSSKLHAPAVVVSQAKAKRKANYHWQSFPDSFSHRVDWVLDLVFNFRGPNWNWRAKSVPHPPDFVLNDIGSQKGFRQGIASKPGIQDPSTKLRMTFYSLLRDYIALDLIKVVMMRDPYFWGFVDNCLPPPWPFAVLSFSPILVRIYRLLLSMSGVMFAVDIIVSLGHFFFLGLSLAFPRFARSITHQPLDEAWLYPPAFGPASSVLDHGLLGGWNIWWHQLFRFGFSESGRFISHLILPDTTFQGENQNQKQTHSSYKLARRIIQVLVAFSMSGLIHAMGSYTAFADTTPFNTFLFFFLQGIGAIAQGLIQKTFENISLPKVFTRTLNFVAALVWLYLTAPLFADDLARSGLWNFDPLPISPLRGALRWGVQGREGWVCWRGSWVERWHGETWWSSGIRFR